MAADWEEDSPRLRGNLIELLETLADAAPARHAIDVQAVKAWHRRTMQGLRVPDPALVGVFRGEPGAERLRVHVGSHEGVPPAQVAGEVGRFEATLARVLARLDEIVPAGAALTTDGAAAVVELAAWAHGEWVRIHPFCNGNGRTARILANVILMRYGLPPALRLRPRPEGRYAVASFEAMRGNHQPMVAVIVEALRDQTAPPP
ncbi:Fic family protein [Piscinibacter sp.]|uniref:Fic family protein n=1 Tax=Piscinibacter sp. TaxID=1903157 RepID=UPI0039E62D4A